MKDDTAALREQLQQLKALHASGTLGAKAYESARATLERKLLDSVMAAPAAKAGPRPPLRLTALLGAAVLALAAVGYGWTGSPGTPSAGTPAAASAADGAAVPHGDNEQQFVAAVEQLAQRLKEQPDNPEGWAMLARSYSRLGRHAEAVPAFVKAVALQGNDARLLADYADTLAVKNNRSLAGEPMKLVERALKIDPESPKALALAGTDAFERKDYAAAVRYWEKLGQVLPADSGFLPDLQSSIAQARELGGLPKAAPVRPSVAAATVMPPMAAATPAPVARAVPAASEGSVQGSVRLSPALAKSAAPTDTVFIFARAAEGSRMPLAILRKQVKDLPFEFKLDDSQAMSPATKLSGTKRVIVGARVSKSGQAMPQAGDLEGLSAPVDVGATGLVVEISAKLP